MRISEENAKYFLDYTKAQEKPKAILYDPTDPDKIIVSEGNFGVLKGKQKSFKSYACSLFAMDFFIQHPDGIALFADTEQGNFHAANIPRRICKGLHRNIEEMYNSGQLLLAALRKFPTEERETAFFSILRELRTIFPDKPILVFLDGVRDLVKKANEEEPSRELGDKLLNITAELNIGMICVIHTKKDGTDALGHLGGEVEKKGEQIMELTRREDGGATVKCLPSRNPEFDEFDFCIDVHGIPYRVNKKPETILPTLGTAKETKALQSLPWETYNKAEWCAAIKLGCGCGDNTAAKYFSDFVDNGFLIPVPNTTDFFKHYKLEGEQPKEKAKDTQQQLNQLEENNEPPF